MLTSEEAAKWRPMTGMPAGAETWTDPTYQKVAAEWQQCSAQLKSPHYDKTIIDTWAEERARAFAIETGQIEGLYVMPRGMTEMMIVEGLSGVELPHEAVAPLVASGRAVDLIQDQKHALEMVFSCVKQERPLSHFFIKELHALLTRHQEFAPGITIDGKRKMINLRKGQYKIRPNNPKRADGIIHEYCPPEHVQSEMDNLLAMYADIKIKNYPTAVESAWLHHRYIRTHPFQDGNGRTARLLMAYSYIRRNEFPPIVKTEEKDQYLTVLNRADRGDLRPFAEHLSSLATLSIRGAILNAQDVLDRAASYHHQNGDISVKEKNGKWERKRHPDLAVE